MITQFVLVALLVTLAIVFVGSFVFAALLLLPLKNEPENRPAPIGLIAANEQARIASLKRVAARQHQAQRDASARISRGF